MGTGSWSRVSTFTAPPGVIRAESGTAALVARMDLYDSGALSELSQIRGKTIAVLGRNLTPDYYMETAFKRVGMTLDDVSFSTMQLTDPLM